MPRYDFTSQRLFMDTPLSKAATLELDRNQANYLLNVLRLKPGAPLLVFNGRDGEWQAQLEQQGRKKASLVVVEQTRPQTPVPDLVYLFAPLKQARLDYMVQKAVEMGVGDLQPVFTEFTQMRKLNLDKMQAHVFEAAEQCGIMSLPSLHEPLPLKQAVEALGVERMIIFCDEGEASQNPLQALKGLAPSPLAVLIGPEGGFSQVERVWLRARSNVVAMPLGPRVLRADTAAVAALAIVQAQLGDWRD